MNKSKTFVQINPAVNQPIELIEKFLSVYHLHFTDNPHNELLIEVPAEGLGLPLKLIRIGVSPAEVRMFDQYIKNGTEERHYYID